MSSRSHIYPFVSTGVLAARLVDGIAVVRRDGPIVRDRAASRRDRERSKTVPLGGSRIGEPHEVGEMQGIIVFLARQRAHEHQHRSPDGQRKRAYE